MRRCDAVPRASARAALIGSAVGLGGAVVGLGVTTVGDGVVVGARVLVTVAGTDVGEGISVGCRAAGVGPDGMQAVSSATRQRGSNIGGQVRMKLFFSKYGEYSKRRVFYHTSAQN